MQKLMFYAVLLLMGAGWGLTVPLTKITVSTGYGAFGLIFWQFFIVAFVLNVICIFKRRMPEFNFSTLFVFFAISTFGTLFPNSASYIAAFYLPAGVIAVLIATVPMFAFPIAALMGNEAFEAKRLWGVFAGFLGVLLLVGPEATLPDRSLVWFVPIALIAPFFYGVEGNFVARFGTAGQDAIQTLAGASILGVFFALPLAVGTGQWINPFAPWDLPNYTHVLSSLLHTVVYTTYVWLVGRAGAVFAAQVSYYVMVWAVVWAYLLLGEQHSSYLWAALACMIFGMSLVAPKQTK